MLGLVPLAFAAVYATSWQESDADEVLVERAKILRNQAGPAEVPSSKNSTIRFKSR
jgi:hypothetical protein